ncbi:hypothetical protein F0P96_07350 [Hymenobacter busanensis]|uniref:Uncharacterized protein n=1 Tax=Hymenobacter busanensis TaxID=2607656 RepID=A0A7L4ZZI6_9BACT|nr:hypothetical protein [Hymenobacter busanensis]KAA9338631.1 hypothetical protein F0P96_07350 [Hymenobacter busanensis]QHJ08939.1 hypothetical protein GUY19_17250 [Hymenobacter busanensis]
MARTYAVLLLLTYYLLVVGAGLVGRPEPLRPPAKPYVHSNTCQRDNYLRLDCFDHCNGEQQALQKRVPLDSWQHVLTTVKSLDVHCASAPFASLLVPVARSGRTVHAVTGPPLVAGIPADWYLPPRQG